MALERFRIAFRVPDDLLAWFGARSSLYGLLNASNGHSARQSPGQKRLEKPAEPIINNLAPGEPKWECDGDPSFASGHLADSQSPPPSERSVNRQNGPRSLDS